jgi:hypothetical protein
VIRTIVVHFVAELLNWHAILAFLIGLMLAFTLSLHLRQVMFKALMLELSLGILHRLAIYAFLVRTMSALMGDFLCSLFCYSKAVDALAIRTMSAM